METYQKGHDASFKLHKVRLKTSLCVVFTLYLPSRLVSLYLIVHSVAAVPGTLYHSIHHHNSLWAAGGTLPTSQYLETGLNMSLIMFVQRP